MVKIKDIALIIALIVIIVFFLENKSKRMQLEKLDLEQRQKQIEITRLNQINDSLLITIDKRNKRIDGLKTIKKDIKKQIKKDEKDVINIKSTDSIAKLFARYYPDNS